MSDAGGADPTSINSVTDRIIGSAFDVHNVLGSGYLEKVYENALAHELRKAGVRVEQQRRLAVHYDGIVVGDYVADLVIEDVVLVEVKAIRAIDDAHLAQCLNYLTALHLSVGLLNFSRKVQIKRVIHS